jgi:hypothetical protein
LCQLLIAMLYELVASTSPMSTNPQVSDGTVQPPYPPSLIQLSLSETSIVTIPTGATKNLIQMVTSCKTGHHATTSTSSTTPSREALFIRRDGSEITRRTSAGSPWLMVILNQPPAQSWTTFPTASTVPLLSTLVCAFQSSEAWRDEDGTSERQTGQSSQPQPSGPSHSFLGVVSQLMSPTDVSLEPS